MHICIYVNVYMGICVYMYICLYAYMHWYMCSGGAQAIKSKSNQIKKSNLCVCAVHVHLHLLLNQP